MYAPHHECKHKAVRTHPWPKDGTQAPDAGRIIALAAAALLDRDCVRHALAEASRQRDAGVCAVWGNPAHDFVCRHCRTEYVLGILFAERMTAGNCAAGHGRATALAARATPALHKTKASTREPGERTGLLSLDWVAAAYTDGSTKKCETMCAQCTARTPARRPTSNVVVATTSSVQALLRRSGHERLQTPEQARTASDGPDHRDSEWHAGACKAAVLQHT